MTPVKGAPRYHRECCADACTGDGDGAGRDDGRSAAAERDQGDEHRQGPDGTGGCTRVGRMGMGHGERSCKDERAVARPALVLDKGH